MRSLDAVGNTTTRERSGEDELRFGYDTLDQLLRVSAGMSVQEVYAYDSVGNWAVDGRRHDACNRLTRDNTRTFDYDRDGNLAEIHDSGGDGSASYSYDAMGRLVGATLSSGETITYSYDAIGRRYAVSTSAGTTFTLFDGWQEIGTVEPDGSSRSMLAVGEFRLAADTASGPMYVHAGLERSVIAITNVLGELVEKYRYTAFGLLTVLDAEGDEKDSPALSPWLYHGRLFEEASGLYWMRMRHYSPQLGRFLQPDPAGIAGGINLYAYSNNNPLRYFDPWGLWPPNTAAGDNDGEHGEADPQNEKKKGIKIGIIAEDGPGDGYIGATHKQLKEAAEMDLDAGKIDDLLSFKTFEEAEAYIRQLVASGNRIDLIAVYGHGSGTSVTFGPFVDGQWTFIEASRWGDLARNLSPEGEMRFNACWTADIHNEFYKKVRLSSSSLEENQYRKVGGYDGTADYNGLISGVRSFLGMWGMPLD